MGLCLHLVFALPVIQRDSIPAGRVDAVEDFLGLDVLHRHHKPRKRASPDAVGAKHPLRQIQLLSMSPRMLLVARQAFLHYDLS